MATVAVFIALGGGAYAALKLPNNSVGSKQIKKNAVISKKVRNGSLLAGDFKAGQLPAGARGAKGDQGPSTGPAGGDLTGNFPTPLIKPGAVDGPKVAPDSLTGANINESSLDLARAYTISRDAATVCGMSGCNASVTLPNLPAGTYAIFAKVEADTTTTMGDPRTATCTLTAGSDSDRADIEGTDGDHGSAPPFAPAVSARLAMLPLQILHTFDATGEVVMTCLPDSFFFRYAKITAIKLSQATIAP